MITQLNGIFKLENEHSFVYFGIFGIKKYFYSPFPIYHKWKKKRQKPIC